MRDELLGYYERELTYIRRLASEFAGRHPSAAGALLLEADKCEDPHVERLIESFALLTSRMRELSFRAQLASRRAAHSRAASTSSRRRASQSGSSAR